MGYAHLRTPDLRPNRSVAGFLVPKEGGMIPLNRMLRDVGVEELDLVARVFGDAKAAVVAALVDFRGREALAGTNAVGGVEVVDHQIETGVLGFCVRIGFGVVQQDEVGAAAHF